jgi:hypothetical protein
MDPFSGPKGSPLDAKVYPSTIYQPIPTDRVADPLNTSTGALATGIGFGLAAGVSGGAANQPAPNGIAGTIGIGATYPIGAVAGKFPTNFTDDYIPGMTKPDGTAAADATMYAIGGGRSNIVVTGGDVSKGLSTVVPFSAVPILAFGDGPGFQGNPGVEGSSRDAGAGPAFTGFPMKSVTAAGAVADGAAIEANWINRSGAPMVLGGNAFGSGSAASVGPTLEDAPPEAPAKEAKNGDEQEKIEKEFDSKLEKELEKKPVPQTHKK